MLKAIAEGETDPAALAALADGRLRAKPEQTRDALGGVCAELHPVYRRLIQMALEESPSIDKRMEQLEQQMADLLRPNEGQVQRLAEVPGLGLDSAQQILTEVGATAATFPSEKHLASWVGACPGNEESAEVNYSRRSPQGNHHMRRILNQAANAAVKLKGSIFEIPGSPAGSRNLARCPKSQVISMGQRNIPHKSLIASVLPRSWTNHSQKLRNTQTGH